MRQLQTSFEKEREFMSNVSHELLTPTSILQSRFENMLQDPTLPEPQARQLVESQRTLYRLRNTVRTLLLIANIENEQYLRDENVSLTRTVADVADELDDRRQQREIELRVDLQPDYVVPRANASLLHTLLRNLLSNAIKYNNEGGQLRVLGRPTPPAATSCGWRTTAPALRPKTCRCSSTASGASTPPAPKRPRATAWACPSPRPSPASTTPRCGLSRRWGRARPSCWSLGGRAADAAN
ncbi:MAG: histidine kinase dimerization/phospho-acceptor domain-containing protein [Hymenobacter sp.]